MTGTWPLGKYSINYHDSNGSPYFNTLVRDMPGLIVHGAAIQGQAVEAKSADERQETTYTNSHVEPVEIHIF